MWRRKCIVVHEIEPTWSLTFFWNWTLTRWGCAPSDLNTQRNQNPKNQHLVKLRVENSEGGSRIFTANRFQGYHREVKELHCQVYKSWHSKLLFYPSPGDHHPQLTAGFLLLVSLLPHPLMNPPLIKLLISTR